MTQRLNHITVVRLDDGTTLCQYRCPLCGKPSVQLREVGELEFCCTACTQLIRRQQHAVQVQAWQARRERQQ